MRRFLAGLFVLAAAMAPASGYEKATVAAAQEALARLGYDVGTPDGAWGAKSRAAMNELRAKHGLPPADDFTGSSLWLIHQDSPGSTTLPHPGKLITDLDERRMYLTENKPVALQCTLPVGMGVAPDKAYMPDTVQPIKLQNGIVAGKDDWYSEINEGLIEAQGRCLAGQEKFCSSIVTMVTTWAKADALKPGVRRDASNAEEVNWISNTLLRAILFAYDTASNFETVEPQTHALVLDWLKRRIDHYHYQRKQNDPASNHAVAMMMPAAIFGAMVGDRSMMEPAFKVWQRVLSSMREDGSLPREARRGARWFHYGSMQIGQLLTISQLAKSQDIELVAEQPSKSIPDAANFLVTALGDFSLANRYAKANEAGGETNDYSIPFVRKFHFGFVPAYQAMFGDDATIETMRTGPIDAELCALSARQDQKFKGCRTVPATLRDAFRSIGYEPDQNMGYPAGCFVGLTQFPLGD